MTRKRKGVGLDVRRESPEMEENQDEIDNNMIARLNYLDDTYDQLRDYVLTTLQKAQDDLLNNQEEEENHAFVMELIASAEAMPKEEDALVVLIAAFFFVNDLAVTRGFTGMRAMMTVVGKALGLLDRAETVAV